MPRHLQCGSLYEAAIARIYDMHDAVQSRQRIPRLTVSRNNRISCIGNWWQLVVNVDTNWNHIIYDVCFITVFDTCFS